MTVRAMVVAAGLVAMVVPAAVIEGWRPPSAAADACFIPSPTAETPSPTPSCPPPPRQPPPPDAPIQVTNADNGRTVRLTAGQQLVVSLTPDRPGDVWEGPDRSVGLLSLARLSLDASQTTAALNASGVPSYYQNPQPQTYGPFTLSARTDTYCAHTPTPCSYAAESWTLTVYIDTSANPAASQYLPCSDTTSAPAATGFEVLPYAGGQIALSLSDQVTATVPCQANSAAVPSGTSELFRDQAMSDEHGTRRAHFVPARAGDADINWDRDFSCAHVIGGDCNVQYSSPLPPTHVGVHLSGADAGCIASTAVSPQQVPFGGRITASGTSAPGATVAVWFRRGDFEEFTRRRLLTADASGAWSTTYSGDYDYFVYATSGHCTSPVVNSTVRPVIAGPTAVRRGSTVTLTVHAPGPKGEVYVAFRRAGTTTFSTRRWGFTDERGVFTTTYRADADYRYYATYVRRYTWAAGAAYRPDGDVRRSGIGLTQVR